MRNTLLCIRLLRWLGDKESVINAGNVDLNPGSGRSPREVNGYPLQYSGLGNPTDREAWRATAHSVAESDMTEAI